MSGDMIRCPTCRIRVPCKVDGDQVSISEHYRTLPPPAVDVDPEFWGLVMDVPETTPFPNAERCDASWGVVSAVRALQEGWMG